MLGLPGFLLFMKVIEWGGPNLHWYLLALSATMLIGFRFLYVEIIAPQFNKYTPLSDFD